MLARIASALVLVPAALAVVFFLPRPYFLLVLGALGSICMYEYLHIMRHAGFQAPPWLGYTGLWALLSGLEQTLLPPGAVMGGLVVAGFVASMWRRSAIRERVQGFMVNMLGVLYLGFCLYPAVPLRFDFGDQPGREWLVVLLVTIWVGDVCALLVGRSFGRTRFSPVISPRKTNEGAAAGLLFGTLAAVLLRYALFRDLDPLQVVQGSLLIGMFGQLGDLSESMLKRAAGLKDSSHLIPGHGGVLDRIDSMLFGLPALYVFLLLANP
ncbi:MAG: hypothetical protein FJW35_05445 [Acidobacteria bacterium]|nr:hypothetical protein [Acidobacteriota bacterium]